MLVATPRSSCATAIEGQHPSIRDTGRSAEAGIESPAGSGDDFCDKALAESIIGLYKTEVTHHTGPLRNVEHLGFGMLKWTDWLDHCRLLESIGDIPAAELGVLR